MRPTLLLLVLGAAIGLSTTAARGDDKAECFDGASQGQTLRDQHKLVEARAQFAVCARQVCPKPIIKDCTAWLEQVEQATPTVVVTARDGAGRDMFDVAVSLDGHPFASKITGQATPVDPGPHTFHFETADGMKVDRQVLVREGTKEQAVDVVIGAVPAPAPVAPTTPPVGTGSAGAPPAEASAGGSPGPWRTVGFVTGAVGIAGLGVGVAFGLKAMSSKSDAQCDATNACKSGPLSDARSSASLSTIGFIAGGALLAGGAAMILFAPRARTAEGRSLRLAPAVGTRDAGLLLAGAW